VLLADDHPAMLALTAEVLSPIAASSRPRWASISEIDFSRSPKINQHAENNETEVNP